MIPTIAVIAVVIFAIVALLIFSTSHGELSTKINALAESQTLLAESQTQLAESQSELSQAIKYLSESQSGLTSSHQEMAPLLEALSEAQGKTTDELHHLSQAFRQQAIARLKDRLISLCGGDRLIARQQYELEKSAIPGKRDDWYFKQAISRLMPPADSTH